MGREGKEEGKGGSNRGKQATERSEEEQPISEKARGAIEETQTRLDEANEQEVIREKAKGAVEEALERAEKTKAAAKEALLEAVAERAEEAVAKAYFVDAGMSQIREHKPLVDALVAAARKAWQAGIKDQLVAATGVQTGEGGDEESAVALVDLIEKLRVDPTFEALEAEADARGFRTLSVMVGCGVAAGLGPAVGVARGRGVAFRARGQEIVAMRELTWVRGGVALSGGCDLTLGVFIRAPQNLAGGGYSLKLLELKLGFGASVGHSWDLNWPGFATLPTQYSGGSYRSFMYVHRDGISHAGITVGVGGGGGAALFQGESSDTYVRILATPDPVLMIQSVDFAAGEVIVGNVGDDKDIGLDSYALVLDGGEPVRIGSGQHESLPYNVKVPGLNALGGRVALYSDVNSSGAKVLDEVGWSQSGSEDCGADARSAWINCGTCKTKSRSQDVIAEIYYFDSLNQSWGANTSGWNVRATRNAARGPGDRACGHRFLPLSRIRDIKTGVAPLPVARPLLH